PGYCEIDPLWDQVKDAILTPEQEARLDDYLAARRTGLRAPVNYWPTIREDEREIRDSLKLPADRPLAVLFTNITWDSAVLGRDRVFPDMYTWVVESIRLFAALPEMQLVVRVHPAEVRMKGWETRDPVMGRLIRDFPELPPNVRVVPPTSDLSSYTLMTISQCGLAYSSTAGLEMAMEGIPVVVAGQVHYAFKGFTMDPLDPMDYARLVTDALKAPRNATARERARRYGYALFFRYHHSFPVVSENAPDFVPTLNATDPGVLDRGGDPTLDRLCQAILSGRDFFVPE